MYLSFLISTHFINFKMDGIKVNSIEKIDNIHLVVKNIQKSWDCSFVSYIFNFCVK